MIFGIKNATGNRFFAGFAKDGTVIWTADKSEAWVNDYLAARCQASALICQGYLAQRKPVAA